jgi:hypothetical protein
MESFTRSVRPRLTLEQEEPVTTSTIPKTPNLLSVGPDILYNIIVRQTPIQVDITSLLSAEDFQQVLKNVRLPTRPLTFLPIETMATFAQFTCLFQLYRDTRLIFHVHIVNESLALEPKYSVLAPPCENTFTQEQFQQSPLSSTSKWNIYADTIIDIVPLITHADIGNPNAQIEITINDPQLYRTVLYQNISPAGLNRIVSITGILDIPNDDPATNALLPKLEGQLNINSFIDANAIPALNTATRVSLMKMVISQYNYPFFYQYIMGNTFSQLPLHSLEVRFASLKDPFPNAQQCNQWIMNQYQPVDDYTYCGAEGLLFLALQRNTRIKRLYITNGNLTFLQDPRVLIPLLSNLEEIDIYSTLMNKATRNVLLSLPNLKRYKEEGSSINIDSNLLDILESRPNLIAALSRIVGLSDNNINTLIRARQLQANRQIFTGVIDFRIVPNKFEDFASYQQRMNHFLNVLNSWYIPKSKSITIQPLKSFLSVVDPSLHYFKDIKYGLDQMYRIDQEIALYNRGRIQIKL